MKNFSPLQEHFSAQSLFNTPHGVCSARPEITLQRLRLTHVSALADLLSQSKTLSHFPWWSAYAGLPREQIQQILRRQVRLWLAEEKKVWVIFHHTDVCGLLDVKILENAGAWIPGIWVADVFQRRGVAFACLNVLEKILAFFPGESGRMQLWICESNAAMRRMAQRLGYVPKDPRAQFLVFEKELRTGLLSCPPAVPCHDTLSGDIS